MMGPVHKVVVAVMVRRGDEVLLHRRPAGGWGAGLWEFPGGKLEPGEDPRDAIRRECEEELGVAVEPGAVYDVRSHHYEDLGPVVLLFWWASLAEGAEPRAMEGGEIEWVPFAGLVGREWVAADIPVAEELAGESGGVQ